MTLAAQSMQTAGLISYRRGTIQVLDRAGLEKASCECYAIVKERFDAFLTPPSTAVPGRNKSRSDSIDKDEYPPLTGSAYCRRHVCRTAEPNSSSGLRRQRPEILPFDTRSDFDVLACLQKHREKLTCLAKRSSRIMPSDPTMGTNALLWNDPCHRWFT